MGPSQPSPVTAGEIEQAVGSIAQRIEHAAKDLVQKIDGVGRVSAEGLAEGKKTNGRVTALEIKVEILQATAVATAQLAHAVTRVEGKVESLTDNTASSEEFARLETTVEGLTASMEAATKAATDAIKECVTTRDFRVGVGVVVVAQVLLGIWVVLAGKAHP